MNRKLLRSLVKGLMMSLLICAVLLAGCGEQAADSASSAADAGAGAGTGSNAASGSDAGSSAGADANASAGAAADSAANSAVDSQEHMEISVAIWGIQEAFDASGAANDQIFNDMCERLNITIVPKGVTWNDYQEKNKVWAASGTLPDLFVDSISTDNNALYRTWAEQGIIKALPSDLSAYPNLQIVMAMDSVRALDIDGKQYMIPRGNDPTAVASEASGMSRAMMYRKDWAAEAGYNEAPKTFDEFVTMVKAMQANHPEASGISANNTSFLATLTLDIFPEYVNEGAWVYENNQWIPAFASARVVPYIERMQFLYSEGILDPDFMTQKDGDAVAKFASGRACVMLGGEFNPTGFMESNPSVANLEDALGFIVPFPADDGNRYVFSNVPYWSETYINADVDDAKFQRILAFMDFLYSHDDFGILMMNGIKGIDWDVVDGKNVSLLGTDESLGDKYPITSTLGWLGSWWGGFDQSGDNVESANPSQATYDRLYRETYAYENEHCLPAPINFDVFLLSNDEKQATSGMGKDFVGKANNLIISNTDAQAGWEAIVTEFMNKGLREAITSVTAQAAEMGIQP